MTVELYEGCFGVTRGGDGVPQEVVGPISHNTDDPRCYPFYAAGGAWHNDGMRHDLRQPADPHDIIAVFPDRASAEAWVRGDVGLPDELTLYADGQGNLSSWLPWGDKPYETSKWRRVQDQDGLPPCFPTVELPSRVIDWGQRRWDASVAIMAAIAAKDFALTKHYATAAVRCADALIAAAKETGQ